jgi:hypothetical protein
MMAKDLEELQQLFKEFEEAFPAAERVGGVDKDVLEERLKAGQLSESDAAKLRTDLKRTLGKSKAITPEVVDATESKALVPTKQDVIDADFTVSQDYSAGKGQRLEMPGAGTQIPRPEQAMPVGKTRRFDAAGKEIVTDLVPVPKPGPLAKTGLKIPGMPDVASDAVINTAKKNPLLKKLLLPVVAAAGAATYFMGDEEKAPAKKVTPEPGPAPAPAPEPAPEEPAQPKEPLKPESFESAMSAIAKRYEEDRKLSPEVASQFAERQQALQASITDAKRIYQESVAKARSEADRREAIAAWGSIAEQLGQAMVKYFAAREGARTGTLLGSKVQFQKYDWQKDLDRSLKRLDTDLAAAKSTLNIELESAKEQLGEIGTERREAIAERRDVARQKFMAGADVLEAGEKQKAASVEDYIRQQREQQKEQKAAQKEESKTLADQRKNYARLQGALASIKEKDTPTARKQLGEAASLLDIPPVDVEELIKETTGEGAFQVAEPEKVQKILQKYKPKGGVAAPTKSGMIKFTVPGQNPYFVPEGPEADKMRQKLKGYKFTEERA